jgi:hypothetical protein
MFTGLNRAARHEARRRMQAEKHFQHIGLSKWKLE